MRLPGLAERRGRLRSRCSPTTLSRDAAGRVARPRGPRCPPLGPGRRGLCGGCSGKKFHTIAHSRHETYPEAERDASSLRLQGLGERGGPRHSAAATTARGRGCAGPLRTACRPPPNFAQRQHGTASPCRLASRRGRSSRSGARGSRPFPPPALPFLLCPHPAPRRASQAEQSAGTELRRRGGRGCSDVSSLRGYLYTHDWISFMKPGPGVSVRLGAVAKVPQL